MKITIDKRNLEILMNTDEIGLMEYQLGYLLTDFLSLNKDYVLSIINDGTTLESPKTNDEAKNNIEKLYTMINSLAELHPYFSYINDIVLSEKKDLDRYGFTVQYSDEDNIWNFSETEYDDIHPLLLDNDETYFDSSDIGIMKWLRHQIRNEFIESYNYYSKAIEFIFNLECTSPGDDEQSLKRYYLFKEYASPPPRRLSFENTKVDPQANSHQNHSFDALNPEQLQVLFDDFQYVDSFYSAETLSEMLNLEMFILAENKALLKRCKHCRKLYPQLTRYEEFYCKRSDPATDKPCRIIGPRNVSSEMKKTNQIIKEFNKAYSRIYKAYKKGTYTEKAYRDWLSRAKNAREQVRNGEMSFEEYRRWVSYIDFY